MPSDGSIDLDTLAAVDWEAGRKAVEDALIAFRDDHISILRNNGLVVKDYDGTPSSIIRLSIEDCLQIGMRAIVKARSQK